MPAPEPRDILSPRFLTHLAALLWLMALGSPAQASPSGLMEAVHAFLYQQSDGLGDEVSIEVFPPAAQLPECRYPDPFLPGNGQQQWGRIAVGVRCGPQGEQVRYMQAQITVIGRYLVATRPLEAGTHIVADMLEYRQGDLGKLPRQAILNIDEIVGQRTRRPLAAGTVIQRHQLREIPLVERGQQVIVEAVGPGYRITREGKAMAPGAMGERIRVRVSGRTTLSGVVVGQARVAVP